MISLPNLFEPLAHLHLVIWNRLDASDHAKAMNSVLSLMECDETNGIMPLLRPLGRPPDNYCRYASEGAFVDVDAKNLCKTPLRPDGKHTAHCEIWIQVADTANAKVREYISDLFSSIPSVCLFWDNHNPVWQPLGNDKFTCEYSRSRSNTQDKFLCSLCDDRIAWVLKLIWFRATAEISDRLREDGGFKPIHPINDKASIKDLMSKICSDINLKDYNLSADLDKVDPTAFGASHLATFAVNSMTEVENGKIYALEEFFESSDMTRPCNLPDRSSFLKLFD